MSYCRFIEGDAYVYGTASSGGDMLECCGCILSRDDEDPFPLFDRQGMLTHLLEHRAAGHSIPQYAIDLLTEEIAAG